jgi:hypothetical protein
MIEGIRIAAGIKDLPIRLPLKRLVNCFIKPLADCTNIILREKQRKQIEVRKAIGI